MKIRLLFLLVIIFIQNNISLQFEDGKVLIDRSRQKPETDGFYQISNYEFKCFRQLSICSSPGWSLRFNIRLNPFSIIDRERKSLLFSTGAHEPHGDGILIYLYQSKNTSYLEFGLKEFRNDEFAYYWQIEADLEVNKWIDVVTTIEEHATANGHHNQMTIFFDGELYKKTQVENYTEVFVFKYDNLHPKVAVIYGNDTGLVTFDEILYYERVLSEEEITNVSTDRVSLGCLKENDRVHQYMIPEQYDKWQQCREDCHQRRMKIGLYSLTDGRCGCISNTFELDSSFKYEKNFCKCPLPTSKSDAQCSIDGQWHVMSVSNVIDLIDSEVGLQIRLADSSFLVHGRTRAQINEGVEIIVTVKNERNLASLTVYGDIEGQEVTNSSSSEIYITAGVVNLSWKNEGAKKVQFRADYRRVVNHEMAEYRTVYVDVVYVKTDLPLQFVQFSPDNRNGHMYQNFTIQTFGSVPINCTVEYGDGSRQIDGTSRHQYYTAYFSRNYTRYGQYNISARCYNERSANSTYLLRTVRRENMNRKMIIYKDLVESSTASRFNLISREDYSFQHASCLYLKNAITNDKMKLIWRKKTLEIIPNEPLAIGKHLYQLECDSVALQAYYLYVQPAIRSLDIEASQTTIKAGQSIQYSITLEPTLDLTIIFDCDIPKTPLEIIHIPKISDISPIVVANCTYTQSGQYHPLVSAVNRINLVNQSIRIDVEEPLSPFKVDIEDCTDVNQLSLVVIRALEHIPFEGLFTLTIIDRVDVNVKNVTRTENIQLLPSNNFTEQFYMNITTYGRQTLHVRGGDYPTIREAQTTFTVGTEITTKPQVYILNQMAIVNEDFTWVDVQWINGIGFDVQIDFGNEKKVLIRYAQIISTHLNRMVKKNDGAHEIQWKRLSKHRIQVGYKFTKAGTYKIEVKFVQPSSKFLTAEITCPTVVIVKGIVQPEDTCFQEQQFSLTSPNAINNITLSSHVLLLPYSLQHHLEPVIVTPCSDHDLIYSFYLLSIDSTHWKYSRTQRYSNSIAESFEETFLSKDCSELGPKSTLTIEPNSLPHGYYLAVFTVTTSSNQVDFRQFIQPIEIIRSDLVTTFGGNETITIDGQTVHLDFYSSTIDPDTTEFDRRKLNFTLICYPEDIQSSIFYPNTLQLGASRPTSTNPQNLNNWSIQWNNLTLVTRRPELNILIYENQCFIPKTKRKKPKEIISFNPRTKRFNMTETDLEINNGSIYFLLIIRHLTDGRQLVSRLEVDKKINYIFDTADLSLLEEVMGNLDDLAANNPQKAVALISGLADKLNEMSDNSTMGEMNETEAKLLNDRMSAMRSKMLSSMDTVLESANDPGMVDKALKASATVTANSDQMPLSSQEKGAGIIEKVGSKVKEMESADENTVTELASSLMDVGGNVLQAASKTVSKDKDNDPDAVIENLESDMRAADNDETDTKVIYAPTSFYDSCDDCDTLPEERWEEFRHKLEDEKKTIVEGRERASNIAKRSAGGLFTVGDALANRSTTNETKTIESKTMAMSFSKAAPDGKSSISAGDTSIRLPNFSDLNSDSDSSNIYTKVLESKDNPYASASGNTNVQGSVITIVLSNPDGSEMPVTNSTEPIAIRLTRPVDKRPKFQEHELHGTSLQYHKVELPEKNMTLSIYAAPNGSPMDTYAVYISYSENETLLEPPTESKFDLIFVLPNQTALTNKTDLSPEEEYELRHTVFLPPGVHFGNGTYIIGVRLLNASTPMNLTEYNSSYTANMYVSKCQYWDEKRYVWSSEGCEVGPLTTLKSTECLCRHLTTFGGDFYVPPNTIDFSTVFLKFKKLHENAAVFSTVMVILGLYIIAAVWTRRTDKQDLIKWTASPLMDNLPIDTYHYLITVHTGVGKEAGSTSNISFVMSGESSDSGVRKLSDGKIQEFKSGSVRNFLMSVETPLGPLLYVRVWHDNSGIKEKASWYLNMINVMDLQTGEKSYFLCDNWLAVEKGDGLVDRVIPLASSKELKSFAHLFTQSVKKKFSDGHLWFSVFSRPVRSNFTRLQRISCCISLLFCTMISNAMFYKQDTKATENKAGVLMKIGPVQFTLAQLWVSFIGTLIVLPINLIIVTLFRKAKYSQKTLITHQLKETRRRNKKLEKDEQHEKTSRFFSRFKNCSKNSKKMEEDEIERIAAIPSLEDTTRTLPHWTIYIAWGLVALSILTCAFFIILYSLEWGATRANEWLMTMMLSFGQSILVIDPLKVFIITAIISFLIRRPYDDETLDFNDPFTGALLSNNHMAENDDNDGFNDSQIKEVARQRRVRLFDLRPIDSTEMARAREQRLREIKMGEIIREIVVYIFFTVVLLFLSYQARDTNSYGLYRDTKNLFITDDFHGVDSLSTWWDYCDNVLLKGLYAQTWYNNKSLSWREKLTTGSRVSMRVGAPRIRQLRVKENSCRVHRRVKHVITHCRDDYNWIDDDTKDYTPRWEQVLNKTAAKMSDETNDGKQRCRTPWCYQSSARTKSGPMKAVYKTYKGGGYVVSLGRTCEKARTLITELRSQNWLDQLTRGVIIDFSLYNANVNLFVAVTLSFEMTSMGSVIQDYQIKIFRLYDHIGGYGIIVYLFEFLFVVFTIYSAIHETLSIIKLRREYFDKFWNIISFVTAVFSVTAIGMYGTKKTLTRLAIRSLRKTDMGEFVNFNAIGSFDEVYSYIVALVTFFTMLKFLKLLRFNKRMGMLSKSLHYAQKDLSSFGFVFIIFMVAYAHMGFGLFGRSLQSYKSFFTALTTCFRMLLGEINAPDMLAVSRVYGSFYFLSFIILVFVALLSIFLTILNDSFAHVKRELAASQQKNEMVDFMWSTFRKVAGINKKKPGADENEIMKNNIANMMDSMNNNSDAPLAKFETEDL
ncbi:unnamed protein product [Rotaria magnacalcarata]|uniref:Polycystic kidney disease protein 1-like 2 n=2 Tax=Rotaria magnacalcarata TaxID=392030 RepID=A0A816NIK6_9BILA|nr:unnamed protein product [Rotaria magnacalcarata]CAF1623099.1 unnamed protein product [Rotaria magnacalcarata]CAF2033066.1 unnamed protein product [Rotaria magnacalcarata]CAF3807125.1 unnamed protein product [Rotaria magnacalcarata]